MRKGLKGFPRERLCVDCEKEFISNTPRNIRCGSVFEKGSCTYTNNLKRQKEIRYPRYKERDYEVRRIKRRKPEVKKKIAERIKRWSKTEQGRISLKRARKKFAPKMLELTRKRRLLKKGIMGTYTEADWDRKKKEFNYCCARCGIPESRLKELWGKQHWKLTRDHILPISKGGTDRIINIQPLCISCNCKKHDAIDFNFKVGITFGAWDFVHAGHCMTFQECKQYCEYLIVGLHEDPSIERPEKNKPIMTVEERLIILSGNRYIDNIIVYKTENDLLKILENVRPDVRIIGEDHKGKPFTGDNLPLKTIFNSRQHTYSSASLRQRIKDSL